MRTKSIEIGKKKNRTEKKKKNRTECRTRLNHRT